MQKIRKNLTRFIKWIGECAFITLILWGLRALIVMIDQKTSIDAGGFFNWLEGITNLQILESFFQLLVLTFIISFAKWTLPISKD